LSAGRNDRAPRYGQKKATAQESSGRLEVENPIHRCTEPFGSQNLHYGIDRIGNCTDSTKWVARTQQPQRFSLKWRLGLFWLHLGLGDGGYHRDRARFARLRR
jgi:hypothetical protein